MVQPSLNLNCTVPDTVYSKRDEHNGQQSCDNAQEPTPSMRAEAYPQSDSGTGAYRALLGSWFSLLPASGLLNSTGILQAYFAENQLKHFTESQISWIFSIFAFLFFFGGILVGPLYDKYRLWPMMPLGGYGLVLSLLMLSFCSSYYQFILALSILGGASASIVWNCTVATLSHWFYHKRGLAVGLATSAGGIGGIIIPILLQKLEISLGFHWAVRILAAVTLVCTSIGLCLTRSRLPGDKTIQLMNLDWAGFRDKRFSITIGAIFVIDWAVLVPAAYLTTHALQNGVSPVAAGYIIAAMNASATFGRIVPGAVADKIGRFNVMVGCSSICSILCFTMWLNIKQNLAIIFSFAVLYGFFSGPAYSLTPVCVAQLCRTEVYARRYGTAYGIVSIATLFGVPLSGLVLGNGEEANYDNLVIFCGTCYAISAVLFAVARGVGGGWSFSKVF